MNISMTHDEVINKIKKLSHEIELEDAVRAFLYSLSTCDNKYRTVLSSVIWGRSLVTHEVKKYSGYYGSYHYCEICNLRLMEDDRHCIIAPEYYSKYRQKGGELDINEAGYVLVDLQEFKKLPKVDYCEKDIAILNRIFGLVKELGPANKVVALQKLITAEKFMKATKHQINAVLGVLAVCGVFDTPEQKSVATTFVGNHERHFSMECDLYYPLNFWRGKYGINYGAVNEIFAPVVGDALSEEKAICGEVVRKQEGKPRKSKAEKYFEEGKHVIDLSNEQRYYYGLKELKNSWDKITKFSVTYNCYKRSEIYFDGDVIQKMIYEENIDNKVFSYTEIDMQVQTDHRELVHPLTKRGRKQKLTPTLLMTPTYMQGHLMVRLDSEERSCVNVFNRQSNQHLQVPEAVITTNEEFQEYTSKYINSIKILKMQRKSED